MVITKILNTTINLQPLCRARDSIPRVERTRDNLTSRLLKKELRVKPSVPDDNADEISVVALASASKWKNGTGNSSNRFKSVAEMECWQCHQTGHIKRNCPELKV